MSVSIDQSLVLDAPKQIYGNYRQTRLIALDSTTRTLLKSSVSESLIEIPANKPFNLSKSYLSADSSFTKGADANGNVSIHQLHSYINRLVLETRSGQRLVDLNFCAEYMKTVLPVALKNSDLQDRELSLGDVGKVSTVSKSNKIATVVASTGSNSTRISALGASNAPLTSYTDFQYVTQSAQGQGLTQPLSIPFKDYKHTILSLDKDMIFPESLNLRITWNSFDSIAWSHTTTANYDEALTESVGGCTLNNIRMYLAVQVNNSVVAELMNKMNSGYSIPIDYPYSYQQATAVNVSSVSPQTRLNRGQGTKVRFIYTSIFNGLTQAVPADNLIVRYDHSNVINDKCTTIQTQMNSQNLQEIVVSATSANNEAYEYMRENLKGSAIQNSDMFNYNFVWVDSWCNEPICDEADQNKDSGLSLDAEQLYTANITMPPVPTDQFRIFTFPVCKRILSVSSQTPVMIN